jgi:arsenate reductase
MLENLSKTIEIVKEISISKERKEVLQPLIEYLQKKVNSAG